jgi:NADH-quinone oxidoreductase subunit F
VPAAVDDPDAYGAYETTLVSLWGDVRRPGVYEVPLRTPLGAVIERYGGGADEAIGLVFPAGPSAAPLLGDQLDVALHPDELRAVGSGLGTASILVIGASTCPISVARRWPRSSSGRRAGSVRRACKAAGTSRV